jgi:hypothetical protein
MDPLHQLPPAAIIQPHAGAGPETLNALTPDENICKNLDIRADRFIFEPIHQMQELNTQSCYSQMATTLGLETRAQARVAARSVPGEGGNAPTVTRNAVRGVAG